MTWHFFLSSVALLGFPAHESRPEKMEVLEGTNFKLAQVGTDAHLTLGLSAEGDSVFVASDESSQIWQYDTRTGRLIQRFDTLLKYIWCLKVSSDGSMLAAGGDGLILFGLKDKKTLFHHKQQSDRVNSIAFSPNSKVLAFGTVEKTVKLLTLPDGKEWRSFTGSSGPVMCVALSAEGDECAAGGIDQFIRIWAIRNGTTEKRKISTPWSVTSAMCYSPDGRFLAYSATQQDAPLLDPLRLDSLNEIKVWDRNRGKADSVISEKMTRINSIFFEKNAKYLIAASEDGLAIVWQRDPKKPGYSPVWKNDECRALAVSHNFQKMATAKKNGTFTIWELRMKIAK